MPTFGRTGSGKWHVVGPDGCRYGRAFADDADSTPDETVTATDIVGFEPPETYDENALDSGSGLGSVSVSLSLGSSTYARGSRDDQRLVLPDTITESGAGLCGSCESNLADHQRRRSRLVNGLKLVTTVRDPDWTVTERDDRRACDWCRAREPTTWHSDALQCTVCPACGRLFETPLGEPDGENAPETDRLPATPDGPVEPVVFGTALPDYDPADLVGSNRPLVKYREKHKYADIVFELERTGHAFDADAIAALDRIRADYADRVADDDAHQTDVTLTVGRTPRTVTLEGVFPDDATTVIDECWDVVSDPDYWFPVGWPEQGYIHRRAAETAIPGDDPVGEAFPRLETQAPAASVDTESLRAVTDPGRYDRGERYYERGAVTDVELVDGRLQATVQGSQPYDVRATVSDGRFVEGECSCPDDASVCKHVVAAVLASGDVEGTRRDRSLEEVLESAPAGELRALVRDLAEDDVSLCKRIYDEFGED